MNVKGKTGMERHIQTILLSVITAAIIFGAQQIFALSVAMAKVQVTLEQLAAASKGYATVQYVESRAAAQEQAVKEHERRIERLEGVVDSMAVKGGKTK